MRYSLCGLFKAIEILDTVAALRPTSNEYKPALVLQELKLARDRTYMLFGETDCPLNLVAGMEDLIKDIIRMVQRREERVYGFPNWGSVAKLPTPGPDLWAMHIDRRPGE